MKKIMLFLLLTVLYQNAFTQTLQRKGSLGVVIEPTENGKGILLAQVLKGGTGAALGLQDNDILLSVNGKDYNAVNDLVALTRTWRSGDKIKVKVNRAGKTKKLKGKVVGKPLETSKNATIIYGAVPYDGGQLRSILELPKGIENPPVLFFLPGIGCGSLDYYYNPKAPIKQLVEGLINKGIAVYRVEKPSMGDSEGTKDCLEMDFDYEIAAFETALKHLKQIKSIDSTKVFLYGHSLGGITAPVIGSKIPVKGIIAWGSISTSWYEYELDIMREQNIHRGMDYLEMEEHYRVRQPFMYDLLVRQQTREELAQNEAYKDIMPIYFPQDNDRLLGMHHYTYFHDINALNLTKAWKESNCDVLAIYGEHDIHAINAEWAKNIAAIVNYYRPDTGSWKILPNTEHGYSKVSSMAENVKMRQEGTMNMRYMSDNFNPEIINVVSEWIKGVLSS